MGLSRIRAVDFSVTRSSVLLCTKIPPTFETPTPAITSRPNLLEAMPGGEYTVKRRPPAEHPSHPSGERITMRIAPIGLLLSVLLLGCGKDYTPSARNPKKDGLEVPYTAE